MRPLFGKAELRQPVSEFARLRRRGGKLDKLQPGVEGQFSGGKQRRPAFRQPLTDLLFQPQQRAIAIFRRRAVGRCAEAVVKDLQRPGAAVAAAGKIAGKLHQRQLPLAGKTAEVAAPFENIHFHQRRVGHLYKGDFFQRHIRQLRQRIAARQHVETVEHDAQRRAIDAFDPRPRLMPAVDVGAPGQRLVANRDAFLLRQRSKGA